MRRLLRKYRISPTLPAIVLAAAAFALVPPHGASAAYTYKTLHFFCSRTNCNDGWGPGDRVIMDQYGILYGTASRGGKYDGGVVFKLVPNSDKSAYKEYVLRNFTENPEAGVILDANGNVYGTVPAAGKYGAGYVFKLTQNGTRWNLSVLKSFCEESNCVDGAYPKAGLSYSGQDSGKAWNGSSPLFGTTAQGGAYGNGVTYELTSSGTYSVIHNFQSGADPNEVLVDSGGDIYGTAATGGKYGGGLMYKLASGTWSETTLHNFCNTQNCADGKQPVGRLAMDASGNLFGTTYYGGSNSDANCNGDKGGSCGVVFERAAGGTYRVVYNFCSQPYCKDGDNPRAGVIIDGSGSLFGTTFGGGDAGLGTVFEISGSTESVLRSFGVRGRDGELPEAAVILDSSGGLFGTTYSGGFYPGDGVVFRLGP